MPDAAPLDYEDVYLVCLVYLTSTCHAPRVTALVYLEPWLLPLDAISDIKPSQTYLKFLILSSQIKADKGYDNCGCSFLDRSCDKTASPVNLQQLRCR
jgi:hypothetical protein